MAEINLLPYFKTPDLVSPIEAGLRLHETRENAKTQRMFAENQMARQSAEDFRREREDAEKRAELERQHKIEAAGAVGQIAQLIRTPGGAGPAMALGSAYGIDVHPLLATTAAAHAPVGDAVDQALAEAGPGAGAPPPGAAHPQGPPASPPATSGAPPTVPEVDPGVAAIMSGQTVMHAPEGDFALPPGTPQNLADAAQHAGYVPRGAAALPPPAAPGGAHPADLEALMSRAAPEHPAAAPAPPMPLLYEAVLGGQHFPLSAEQPGTGLGDKYDAVFKSYLAQGVKPAEAFKAVLTEKEKDDAQAASEHRLMTGIGARNAENEKLRGQYSLTAEQQQANFEKREKDRMEAARLHAAASGAATAADREFLAIAAGMKENGASSEDIAAEGAKRKVNPKVWEPYVATVAREANQNTRTTEKRAGMEFQDEFGNKGVAATAPDAKYLREQASGLHRVVTRMDDLIEHVKKYGSRIDLNSQEYQDRLSMGAAVNAALRPYNKLGGTDASQRLEAEITGALGAPGHGYLIGANLQGLERIRKEAIDQYSNDVKLRLRAGGGSPLPPAVTHTPAAGGGAAKLTPAQLANMPDGFKVAD